MLTFSPLEREIVEINYQKSDDFKLTKSWSWRSARRSLSWFRWDEQARAFPVSIWTTRRWCDCERCTKDLIENKCAIKRAAIKACKTSHHTHNQHFFHCLHNFAVNIPRNKIVSDSISLLFVTRNMLKD